MSEIGCPKDALDTPALWVDLDKMQANIQSLAALCTEAGVQWRPHTKGIKVPAIAHLAVRAGAIGVTCAKLGEAEVMAANGILDLLVANQVVGPRKVERLVRLSRHADVKVAVDSAANVEEIGRIATAAGAKVNVLVELNTGMNRAGVQPGEAALALSRLAHETP
ncbi:MAG: alanine racemase, partial [Candidatus Latescibacterota bacterium]|nr:alanine racemase [Candidatus Latescibacterota bacterium]